MTGDDDKLSDVDRRSIRILASSTKAAGAANARIADRLERAAGSGNREDYRKAEASFDSLPPEERRKIGSHAERQAVTETKLVNVRKLRAAVPKPIPASKSKGDQDLDWKPLVLDHSPAMDEPSPPPPPRPASAAAKDGGAKNAPRPGQPAGGQQIRGQQTGGRPGAQASGSAPARPRRPTITLEPDPEPEPKAEDEKEDGWDWRRIPEDSVSKGSKKKVALDPIEQLRREMLGDSSDKRR